MKILIVDDEQDVEALFRQRFRRELKGGTVDLDFAFSGKEALEKMRQWPHQAVLILSDINMPGMSGLQLLEHIKSEHSDPPPVMMMVTAYGDAENRNQAQKLGADGFITKPVDFKLLKETLKQYVP